jgi:hypothetical protein
VARAPVARAARGVLPMATRPNPDSMTNDQWRQHCIRVRKKGQSSQASAMIRTNRNSAVPVFRGDLVRVYPKDKRDKGGHSMEGIPAIVFNNPHGPGWAVSVWCELGVIGHGRTYSHLSTEVYRKSSDTACLGALRATRDSILRNEFVGREHPIVSMRSVSRWHDQGLQRAQEQQRPERKKCGCEVNRNGAQACNTLQCGCRKREELCSLLCKCGGACANSNS